MLHCLPARSSAFVVSFALICGSLALFAQDEKAQHLRKYKPPVPAARIEVTVLKDFNGKPIEDAHVIFHPIEGDKDKGYLELKTNEDGRALIDVLPIGSGMRLQIIAKGFQTYGADYKIDQPSLAYEIRMKRPGEQYSIYVPHAGSDAAKPAAPQTEQPK